MITAKINLDLIDQARAYKGAKGRYIDLVLFDTPGSEYGDYAIKQSMTKEEREAGKRLPFIGNAKIIGQHSRPKPTPAESGEPSDDSNSPFPF